MQRMGLHLTHSALAKKRGRKAKILSLQDGIAPEERPPKGTVATAIPALVRRVELPISSARRVRQTLPFQIEALTSLDLTDLVYDAKLRPISGGFEATIFFVPKSLLKKHLEVWGAWNPDSVTSIAAAMFQFVQLYCPDFQNGVVVDLGANECHCLALENGRIKKAFTVDGCETSSLQNALLAFEKEGAAKSIFFTGNGSIEQIQMPGWTTFKPAPSVPTEHAIAIGAALETEVQFLRGEFVPKRVLKKWGARAAALLLTSLMCSALVCVTGQQKYRTEMLALNDLDGTRVEQAAQFVQKYAKEFPYLPQTPSVSEVLSWLSSHPAVLDAADPLDIVRVHFQLTSCPRLEALSDPYQAKLELEFRVKSAMSARKFHEALVQGDNLVDAGEEISWEPSSDLYRTSFYLKNRGVNAL